MLIYGYYNIHEMAYSLIVDKEVNEYVRIRLIEFFCDINYNYCEEIERNKINFVSSKTNPNDYYKTKIYSSQFF